MEEVDSVPSRRLSTLGCVLDNAVGSILTDLHQIVQSLIGEIRRTALRDKRELLAETCLTTNDSLDCYSYSIRLHHWLLSEHPYRTIITT
jgi:hypothetical protein